MCFSVQVNYDSKQLSKRFNAKIGMGYFEKFTKAQKLAPKEHKGPDEHKRIYPNYYTTVMTHEKGERLLRPMRYRIRPHDSNEEVPSKYNLFNARIDALEKRQTWLPLFMHNHCLLPFTSFFEWVEDQRKKRQINFRPEGKELMWAPGLYDTWISPDSSKVIHSFAIITKDPPPEIEEMGHDRCPIFLKEEYIDEWLRPETSNINEIYEVLKQVENVHYANEWV